jgi:hypothetical protein
MIIEYELTVDDFVISSFYDLKEPLNVRMVEFFCSFVVSIFFFPLMLFLYYLFNIDTLSEYSLAVFLFFVYIPTPLVLLLTLRAFGWYKKLKLKRSIAEAIPGIQFRKYILNIDDEGISTTSDDVRELMVWSMVKRVVIANRHIYIYLIPNGKIIISRKLFRNILEQKEFIKSIHRYYNHATGGNLQNN